MDNLTPAESIKKAEEMQDGNKEHDPYKNPQAISIIQQEDGNWKLYSQKHGHVVEVRAGKPEDALGEYLTHD